MEASEFAALKTTPDLRILDMPSPEAWPPRRNNSICGKAKCRQKGKTTRRKNNTKHRKVYIP